MVLKCSYRVIRFTFYWALFSCFFTPLYGQEIIISEEKSFRNDHGFEIIGKIGEHLLVFRDRSEDYEILGYDENLGELFSKELDLNSKRVSILGILPKKDYFTLIYKYNKRGRVHFEALKYDEDVELVDSTTIKIVDPRGVISFNEDLVVSSNRRYTMIYDADLSGRIYAFTFDTEKMELAWDKTFYPKELDYEKDFLMAVLDDEAGLHLVYEKDNRRLKIEDARFEFYHYSPEKEDDLQYTIPLNGRLWYDVDFKYDGRNKRLVAGGFYSNGKYNESNGVFYLKINPEEPDAYAIRFLSFDEKFRVNMLGKQLKREGGIDEIDVRDIVLRSDGGVLLIAERNREYTRRISGYNSSYYNGGEPTTSQQIDYHYNDIVLFSIHPNGELHWKEILRKRQYSQDDKAIYSSYFLLKTRQTLRFLYNDEIRFETNVNEYEVSGIGESQRKSLLHTSEDKLSLIFKEARQIEANALVVPSFRKGDFKLVKVSF